MASIPFSFGIEISMTTTWGWRGEREASRGEPGNRQRTGTGLLETICAGAQLIPMPPRASAT